MAEFFEMQLLRDINLKCLMVSFPMTIGQSLSAISLFKFKTEINNLFSVIYLGYYYLVDACYTNYEGFLAPFRGQRYHLKE